MGRTSRALALEGKARSSPEQCSFTVADTGLFFVMRSEGRGRWQSREQGPLPLPLLHVLHLQAEGGEAGQEVGHFIHL